MHDPTQNPSRWQVALDFFRVFWPLLLSLPVFLLCVRFHQPWLGMAVFAAMGMARRYWGTCLFGMANAEVILGGFIACAIIAIKTLTK